MNRSKHHHHSLNSLHDCRHYRNLFTATVTIATSLIANFATPCTATTALPQPSLQLLPRRFRSLHPTPTLSKREHPEPSPPLQFTPTNSKYSLFLFLFFIYIGFWWLIFLYGELENYWDCIPEVHRNVRVYFQYRVPTNFGETKISETQTPTKIWLSECSRRYSLRRNYGCRRLGIILVVISVSIYPVVIRTFTKLNYEERPRKENKKPS